jgi:hypothetical protein
MGGRSRRLQNYLQELMGALPREDHASLKDHGHLDRRNVFNNSIVVVEPVPFSRCFGMLPL